jgi:hypothetical protein
MQASPAAIALSMKEYRETAEALLLCVLDVPPAFSRC